MLPGMAERYRKVSVKIWGDAKFREFSNNGKLLFLFLLTHPAMTSIGAMRATVPGLAAEIGWPVQAFRKAFREALNEGLLEVDEKASLLIVKNFVKHNRPESPNVVKSWAAQIPLLPESPILTGHLQRVRDEIEGLGKAFAEAFPKALPKGMPNPEPEPEPEPEPQPKLKRAARAGGGGLDF